MISTGQKVTIAGVVAALISAIGFVWSQWKQIGPFVEEKPIVAVLVGVAFLALAVFGIVRAMLHRRQMGARVRRAR